MPEPKYKIGDWVKSESHVELEYVFDPPNQTQRTIRQIKKISRQIVGQIVSACYRQTGQYWPQSGGDWDNDPDPPCLAVDKTHFLYLVREGFTNRPLECLPEDLLPIDPPKKGLPLRKCRQPEYDDRCRQAYRDAAKEMPRDKGRFVSPLH